MFGNGGDDELSGGLGNNTLKGGAGNDLYIVNSVGDTLNGGLDNDRMMGGVGNDIYIVGQAGDEVVEETGVDSLGVNIGGVDLVQSSVDFILSRNVENLTLLPSVGIVRGTGNELDNVITGSSDDNLLNGADGNDTFVGGGGNDVLTGDTGSDRFVFKSNAAFNLKIMGQDTIQDFVAGTDKIILDKTTFSGITNPKNGAGEITIADIAIVATDADAIIDSKRIIYSQETGKLFFNTDGATPGFGTGVVFGTNVFGSGGGEFATLQGAPNLLISDFAIQA